ncbi:MULTISPECIES: DUF4232 domain-containing protein [Actinoplanes]|uniref:DUF4232 domain-containing protein n=1 Tax=Actinoplanes TaxID=1865 RepID=UPI0005F2C0DA|nr:MULTISPECIES: DUF4232 domain-containing protein [Actinoplanes]
MTRKRPRASMITVPVLLVAAVALGFVGGARATSASAEESTPEDTTVPACLTEDLGGTVTGQRSAESGVREALLRLTNTSGRACTVQGSVAISLLTPPGEVVDVPTSRLGQDDGALITLAPEDSAWSRLQWDRCDADAKGCSVGVALQYVADEASAGEVAETIAVPEADAAGITMTALRVGALTQTRPAPASR